MCQQLPFIEGGDRKSLGCVCESLSAVQRILLSGDGDEKDLSQLPLPPYHLVPEPQGLSSTAPQLGENKLQPPAKGLFQMDFD